MKYFSLLFTTCLVLFLFPKFVFSTEISKVIYTINKPVDQNGLFVTSTKIYVDDLYTHHLDNEVMEFCDSCFCDPEGIVPCGFGLHTIRLSKSGYEDWLDIRNFVMGDSYEVFPSLSLIVSAPTSTPTAAISPTDTPTSTPTPSKSTYKLNKPKDENGQLITSVKINVDNQYTHHEDDETIYFCDDCFCDTDHNIPCGFGNHTIKLSKSGFYDWSEERNFSAGSNFETTPILYRVPETTSSPTVTSTPTLTPTPSPTQSPIITIKPSPTVATISSVLGEATASASISADLFTEEEPPPTIIEKINKPANYKTPFFIGLLLSVVSGATLYFRHRKD